LDTLQASFPTGVVWLDNLVLLLLSLAVAYLFVRLFVRPVVNRLGARAKASPGVTRLVGDAVSIFIYFLALVFAGSAAGVYVETLNILLALAGLAVVAGGYGLLANLFSYYVLIFTRPFKKGDVLRIGEVTGRVESIDAFFTRLLGEENQTVTIPNFAFLRERFENHTASGTLRVTIPVKIGSDADLGKAERLLLQIAEGMEDLTIPPHPSVEVTDVGSGEVEMVLMVHLTNPLKRRHISSEIRKLIRKVFSESGIELR
jgi:small conductance mechanosensitive channel